MITFEVHDMTCGHCSSSIINAVRSVDRGAQVQIDLARHRVQIEPTQTDAGELARAIQGAGYTPVEKLSTVAAPAAAAPRTGCCCR